MLKEIKPSAAILCHNEEQGKAVEEQLLKQGARWSGYNKESYGRNGTVCYLSRDGEFSFSNVYMPNTEFSDLIIPDMSAEEAWSIAREISNMSKDIMKEIFYDFNYCRDDFWNQYAPGEAKSRIEQWKSDHEKKEPEVEWHYFAEIHGKGFNSTMNCHTEEEAIQFIEKEVKEAGKDAWGKYERVCTLKAVN